VIRCHVLHICEMHTPNVPFYERAVRLLCALDAVICCHESTFHSNVLMPWALKCNDTTTFCSVEQLAYLSALFQVTPGPSGRTLQQVFHQAGCPSCHPTNTKAHAYMHHFNSRFVVKLRGIARICCWGREEQLLNQNLLILTLQKNHIYHKNHTKIEYIYIHCVPIKTTLMLHTIDSTHINRFR